MTAPSLASIQDRARWSSGPLAGPPGRGTGDGRPCGESDVFLIGGELPGFLQAIGDVFPLKHMARALLAALRPEAGATGFAWSHLAVLAAWAVAGALVASRMAWEPRRS